ncbi:MAG: phosphodiesterase YaeI [Bacteroidota bacterium]
MDRRTFLRRAAQGVGGLAVTGGVAAAYVRFVEPHWIAFTTKTVALPHLRAPIRLLHLSDLHEEVIGPGTIERGIALGLDAQPDVICVTGDFFSREIRERDRYVAALRRLSDAAPTFAVAGNHDGGLWVAPRGGHATLNPLRDLLADGGVTFLHNQHAVVGVGREPLAIVGVGDLWARDLDLGAFAGIASDLPTVLLSHNPDSKAYVEDAPWDLMLSGHTHGGQLRIPITGGTPFAPVRDTRFVEGLHAWNGRQLHITRGVGCIGPARLNCRPEVSVLDLVPV